jgi:ferrochelatase
VVREIAGDPVSRLILLPLYPQYSKTTTGSSLNEWARQWADLGATPPPTQLIRDFFHHPLYLEALVERINEGLARFGDIREVYLVFSAHGVPVSVIEGGDPYQAQIEATTRLVLERGRWPNPHALCYQSRVSPGRWLEPSLEATLRALAARGAKKILVVPISFVSDHVETLFEINVAARQLAASLGIKQFELMPALNDSPTFIRALAELVLEAVRADGYP